MSAVKWPAAVVFFLAVCLSCQDGPGDGVAAVVNGYKITYEELDRYYRSQMQDDGEPPSEDQARMLRLNLLREIIDRHIMLQKAEKLGLLAVDKEVEERLEEFRSPYGAEEEFREFLEQRDLSLDELRAEIRRSLTIEKLFNREVSSRIEVKESELQDYYEQNRTTFSLPEKQYHLAQILVTPEAETPAPNLMNDDAQDPEAAKAKIQMLADRLANGEDFAELAQNFSEDPVSTANGGDLGFIPQSSLENAPVSLRRAVAALSPGDISPVIPSDDGYRIFRLISVEPAGQRDFSDPKVQQTIRETLFNRKDQLLKQAFLEMARDESEVKNYYARRIVESFGLSTD